MEPVSPVAACLRSRPVSPTLGIRFSPKRSAECSGSPGRIVGVGDTDLHGESGSAASDRPSVPVRLAALSVSETPTYMGNPVQPQAIGRVFRFAWPHCRCRRHRPTWGIRFSPKRSAECSGSPGRTVGVGDTDLHMVSETPTSLWCGKHQPTGGRRSGGQARRAAATRACPARASGGWLRPAAAAPRRRAPRRCTSPDGASPYT